MRAKKSEPTTTPRTSPQDGLIRHMATESVMQLKGLKGSFFSKKNRARGRAVAAVAQKKNPEEKKGPMSSLCPQIRGAVFQAALGMASKMPRQAN